MRNKEHDMSETKNIKTGEMKTDVNKSVKKVDIAPAKNIVKLTFRENRKFDLHIGRNMVTFMGRQSITVPKKWLEHKDWPNVSKYFIIGD